jgi:hypothetical protein
MRKFIAGKIKLSSSTKTELQIKFKNDNNLVFDNTNIYQPTFLLSDALYDFNNANVKIDFVISNSYTDGVKKLKSSNKKTLTGKLIVNDIERDLGFDDYIDKSVNINDVNISEMLENQIGKILVLLIKTI